MPLIKKFMVGCVVFATMCASAQTINQSVAAEEGMLTKPSKSSAMTVKPQKPEPSVIRVVAIYGSASDLSTDLMVDEVTPHKLLSVGSRIKTRTGDCVVAQIQDRCVRLMPVLVAKQKNKQSISPKACPLACWTGIEPVKQQNTAGGFGAMPPGMPMPVVNIPVTSPVPPAVRAVPTQISPTASNRVGVQ